MELMKIILIMHLEYQIAMSTWINSWTRSNFSRRHDPVFFQSTVRRWLAKTRQKNITRNMYRLIFHDAGFVTLLLIVLTAKIYFEARI